MSVRHLLSHTVAVCFFLAVSVCLPEISRCSDDKRTIQMLQHQENIHNLDREIRSHLDKIRQSGQLESNLLGQLKKIDEEIETHKQNLLLLKEKLRQQEELFDTKMREQRKAEEIKETFRHHLENRLRSFYLMGKIGFLNITFSNKSLPDLMVFNDSFTQLLEYDQAIIDRYHEIIEKLDKVTKARELEKSILQDFIRKAEKEQQALDEIRREKNQMLVKIKSKKGLYEQAVREMQQAEVQLTKTLKDLKKKEEERARGFFLNKGKLAGPVIGTLIVRFGDQEEDGPSKGITIDTAENAPVYSVYGGNVIFAGYKPGYGNMVIIDHNLQYYTITARLDEILVKEGDQVRVRQQIGTTGDIATLFSKGLYFEIRKGSEPLDPLDWLQNNYYPQLKPLPTPILPPMTEKDGPAEPVTDH